MLTPLDIESKVFSKSISGYNASEVKIFMKEILSYYEKFYKENIELRDKINVLQEGIQYYKNIEETLHNTLILAEKMAEDTKVLARQKAEHIEKEAQLRSEDILNDAKHEVYKINKIREELIRSYDTSKIQVRYFLKAQLELTEKSDLELHNAQTSFDHLWNARDLQEVCEESASVALNESDEAEENEVSYESENETENEEE